MKKIYLLTLLLFSTIFYAQDFDKNWKTVYQFELDGQIKSAQEEVQSIYKKAKKKKDEPQIIKCFFYLSKFEQVFDEKAQTSIINNLKNEIKEAKPVSKAILNYLYAEILQNYYNQNSYNINQRTDLKDQKSKDFLTWSSKDFNQNIEKAFAEVMKNETLLRETPITTYKEIFEIPAYIDGKNFSLYDFLIDKNLKFYKSKIESWKYRNNSDSKDLFKIVYQDSKVFDQLNIEKLADENLKMFLKLLQNNERYYLERNPEKADWSHYERLQDIHSIYEDENLYQENIQALELKTASLFLKQQLRADRAEVYMEQATKESKINYHQKALALIDTILTTKINPNALYEAEVIKNNILKKTLSINFQKVLYPNENTRALMHFRNVDSVKISYYKLPVKYNEWFDNTYRYYDESRKYINKDSLFLEFKIKNIPVKTYTQKLPEKGDHFEYSTEIVLEKMDIGNYLIFIETPNDPENNAFTYDQITVSNFSVVADRDAKFNTFQVVDRKTGQPIANVEIKNDQEKTQTNAVGKASFKIRNRLENKMYDHHVMVSKGNDTLRSYYNRAFLYDNDEEEIDYENYEAKAMVYFDRAIYRPGQKIFYKGILVKKLDKEKSVVPFVTVHVTIEDVNASVVKEFDVQTNEFGSFSGEFDLPKNTLTGQFTMLVDEGDDYENDTKYYDKKEEEHRFWDRINYSDEEFTFQVEEYKRPTFEVKFDQIKENYTIGDSIKIRGNAKALAGNNLTNAKVSYSISKYVRGINGGYDDDTNYIIEETQTDQNGNFTINFSATDEDFEDNYLDEDEEEDDEKKSEGIKLFNFTIDVSVTDTNGETRTAKQNVNVGKETLSLQVNVLPELFVENENKLSIQATTLNYYPINASGEIKIEKIHKKKFLKNRLFPAPEIQTISRAEFEQLFPYEPYDKTDYEEKILPVKTLSFDTKQAQEISLDFLKNSEKGRYKITTTATDSNKNIITVENYFNLNSLQKPQANQELFTFTDISKSNSNYFEILIQSVIPDLYITSRFYEDEKFVESEQVLQLQNGKAIFKFLRKKDYKNDLYFHFSTIWENESEVRTHTIKKDILQQQLNFEVISLRNKIEPGSLENWSFKITNPKIEAEILASMYDSSLDQFAQRNWTDIDFYERYNQPNFPDLNIESNSLKRISNFEMPSIFFPTPTYDPVLNWFGFDFNNPKNEYLRKRYLDKIKPKTEIPQNSKLISGTVYESDMPLPGTNVAVKGTTRGTQTDFDGYFELEVSKGEVLEFSYIGMKTVQMPVTKNKKYEIVLQADEAIYLGEVVVVGYGTTTKEAYVGTATKVVVFKGANKIAIEESDSTYYRIGAALEGEVAGVNVSNSAGAPGSNSGVVIRGFGSVTGSSNPLYIIDGIPFEGKLLDIKSTDIESVSVLKDATAIAVYGARGASGVIIITTKNALKELAQVKTRTNFNETAFFYPHLKTDANGQFSFQFTNPESLTRWKLRLYGHNKKAESGYFQTDVISQKDVMVQTNMPRFVREKDTLTISAKVVNMTNETKTGMAMLLLYDATNMQPIDSISINTQNTRNFVCKPKESVAVNWTITIPEGLQGLQYKIVAKSGNFSDGEENILPVLSNKVLITESIPIWMKGNTKKEFVFENLKNNTSNTLKNHQFTLEYTSNPVWFALQSLPYLMEYEHECAEQTFSRYYANFIATELLNSSPKVAALFESWKNNPASTSKLNLNEELKSIVLNETPWLLDAENDELKNKRLALLMDLNTMKESMEVTFKKISEKQMPSGGFSWFDGGNENVYITQHIVAGFGHLCKMFPEKTSQLETITAKAIPYLDQKFIQNNTLKNHQIDYYAYSNLHYLYARSFYQEKMPVSTKIDSIITIQKVEFKANWIHYSLYKKALLALTMHRFGDKDFAKKIITNLKETSARNDDHGMYWIENTNGYYWYKSAIETQALLIQAFTEIEKDNTYVNEMKVWLLKNKQTNHWPTTKATTEAVYALLLQGNDWTSIKDNTTFKIDDAKILTKKLSSKEKEANTGYIKMNWKADEITNEMGTISVQNKSEVPGYGGIYWQYFEDLENIKTDSTAVLSVTKNLYKKIKTAKGNELVEMAKETLKTGDLITIRLIVTTETDLEFAHLKDLRASCFEPVDVISKYEWRDRLSYYRSTKDAATHFFFDEIKKGTYVLEYDVRVNNVGHFNDGISTLQSMYAPEFSVHSKAVQVKVN